MTVAGSDRRSVLVTVIPHVDEHIPDEQQHSKATAHDRSTVEQELLGLVSLDADSSGPVSSADRCCAVEDNEGGPEQVGWLVSSGATEQLLQLVLMARLLSTAVVWLLSLPVPPVEQESLSRCCWVVLDVLEQHPAAGMMPESSVAHWTSAALRVQEYAVMVQGGRGGANHSLIVTVTGHVTGTVDRVATTRRQGANQCSTTHQTP